MTYIRSDVLFDKKGIHIKLDKHVHQELRALSFKLNMSMQEMFHGFATALVNDEMHARRIVDAMLMRKIKATIESLDGSRKNRDAPVGEIDHESLYGLIEDSKREKNHEDG